MQNLVDCPESEANISNRSTTDWKRNFPTTSILPAQQVTVHETKNVHTRRRRVLQPSFFLSISRSPRQGASEERLLSGTKVSGIDVLTPCVEVY